MFCENVSQQNLAKYRSSRPGVFLEKGALKICSEFTGEHHAKV